MRYPVFLLLRPFRAESANPGFRIDRWRGVCTDRVKRKQQKAGYKSEGLDFHVGNPVLFAESRIVCGPIL